jgi:ATP phosphoribosyltransferase
VQIVVSRAALTDAVDQLRMIGGSGVIVTPVTYIFEEQPARVRALRGAQTEQASKAGSV